MGCVASEFRPPVSDDKDGSDELPLPPFKNYKAKAIMFLFPKVKKMRPALLQTNSAHPRVIVVIYYHSLERPPNMLYFATNCRCDAVDASKDV